MTTILQLIQQSRCCCSHWSINNNSIARETLFFALRASPIPSSPEGLVLGGAFLIHSDSTMDLSSIARSVPRHLGGGVPVCNLADSSSWEVLVPPRGLFLFLGDNTICFPLFFGVLAISILLPLGLTDFVAAGRFVKGCFAARDGPFLGLRFWGSSSLPSHAGLRLDTLGIVHKLAWSQCHSVS